jgi:hypothetical protein
MAKAIGIIKISGGNGNIDASINAKKAKAHKA